MKIPKVRNQFEEELVKVPVDEFSHRYVTKLIRNAYWQGFLNERGKLIVREYDWAVRTGDTLFDNMECYDDQLEEALDIHMTDERRERIASVFRDIFHDWMESERDELVVSLLESGEEFADYPKPWDEEGVPDDEAPEGYKQRGDGLEGLEGFEPWAEKEADEE